MNTKHNILLIGSLLLAAGASLQANGKSFFLSIYDEANSGAWQGIDCDGVIHGVFNVSPALFLLRQDYRTGTSLWPCTDGNILPTEM